MIKTTTFAVIGNEETFPGRHLIDMGSPAVYNDISISGTLDYTSAAATGGEPCSVKVLVTDDADDLDSPDLDSLLYLEGDTSVYEFHQTSFRYLVIDIPAGIYGALNFCITR